MKRAITFLICLSLYTAGTTMTFSQEKAVPEKKASQTLENRVPSYDPAGRRDPFRDLLGGRETRTPTHAEGIPQIYIEDVVLVGIVRARGQFMAIINDGQGFPYNIKEGDKFADGFVRLIEESRVIFRKTHQRGIPLMKPKDIIKGI
ncbi:MAG: hypothetical protein PVF22_05235 [Candidatus Aminicenantes bacterium]|jgi:hypothetical protein